MNNNNQTIGCLPDERPALPKLLLYALQQVIVMFPATVSRSHYHRISYFYYHLCKRIGNLMLPSHYRQKNTTVLWIKLSYVSAIVALMGSKALSNMA